MNRDQLNFALYLMQMYGEDVATNYAALVESPDYITNYNRQEKARKRRKPTE